MNDELKTFEEASLEDTNLSYVDPLLKEQQNQVQGMRTTLLSFNPTDFPSAKRAIQNITVLRIYHQIARIIRWIGLKTSSMILLI